MKEFVLDTEFENKDEFLRSLSWHLIHNFGARQCRLNESLRSLVSQLPSDSEFPTHTFKLGEDSKKVYSLFVQFGLNSELPNKDLDYLTLLMQNHFSRLHLIEMEEQLNDLIHRDDVTNLFNQRRLYKDIDEAIEIYQDNQIPFSFLFIDIDHFKSVNDNNGHVVGSKLLIQVGERIKKQVREIDMVYRYGGDEFVVLLPKCSGLEAEKIGNRILEAIKLEPFTVENQPEKYLSVSIGVSDYPRNTQSREGIIRYADEMMYSAKKNGRGQVVYS